MWSYVQSKVEHDAAHVLPALTGRAIALPKEMDRPPVEQHYYDIGDGGGELLTRALDAFERGDRLLLSGYLGQLACPFHLSEALFRSEWHRDFDSGIYCLSTTHSLPFVYDREHLFGEISKFGFSLWLRRHMSEPCERVIEAYKYGNGFAVLKASGFAAEWYNRAANMILAGWFALDQGREENSLPQVRQVQTSSSKGE